MPRKKISKAQKVRNMLDANVSVKEIVKKLSIPHQTVYNIRYQYNKRKGLAQLPAKPGRPRKDPIVVPQEASRPVFEKLKVQQFPTQKEQEANWFVWVLCTVAVLMLIAYLSSL